MNQLTKTFGRSIFEWMESYKKISIKPASYDRLITTLRLMGKYAIYTIPVSAITTRDIQEYINNLADNGYKQTTIKKQFNLITGYLKYANAEGIVERPIQNNVKLPSSSSIKRKKKEIEVYNEHEQERIMMKAKMLENPVDVGIVLMMRCGMRIGEVLAITWEDIDWKRKSLRIHRTRVRLGNEHTEYIQDSAKSYSSNRIVPIGKETYEILRAAYDIGKEGYIVDLSYNSFRWHMMKFCKDASVPYKGMHVFRHTFATNCYYKGCDVKILSKLLGHASVNVTYNTYIHLFGDALEEMRSIID